MTTKPSDLIAIANPKLAQKLSEETENKQQKSQTNEQIDEESFYKSFNQDVWKAVFTLNLFRYGLALFFLFLAVIPELRPGTRVLDGLIYPRLFLGGTLALLVSAICFTLLTQKRRYALNYILIAQFSLDLVITALLTHANGSISSSFVLLFLIVVTTGSVVLRQKHALGLASGAIILLFYEHFYSIWMATIQIEPRLTLLGGYGVLLMFSGWTVSNLAKRLREAELRTYIPTNESIEEYLVRQEIKALKSALASTDGNKTEAAKLLGMTFRSFRYKLTKYDIG